MAKKNRNFDPADEMLGAELEQEVAVDEMDATETADSTAPKEERKWYDSEGNEVSKSAFIREQFSVYNKSRKEISEEFDIPYRTVYGATVNMENEAEPTSRGRGVTFSKIQVTENNEVVFIKDGIVYINGEAQPEGTVAPETETVDRNEWIKEQVAAGVSRGDVAKILDLSYGVIYGLTKDAEGTRRKYEVEIIGADGNPETISRSEYIRRRVADGISKSDIAKELGVEYSVVWQATKKMKTVEEKFVEAVTALEKFMDQIDDPEALSAAIKQLNSLNIKADQAEQSSPEVAE